MVVDWAIYSLFTVDIIFWNKITLLLLGKYDVVDAAYTNMAGFMVPYTGARGSAQEREAKALFNRRHASLRKIK